MNEEYAYSKESSEITSMTGVTTDVQFRPILSNRGSSQPAGRLGDYHSRQMKEQPYNNT